MAVEVCVVCHILFGMGKTRGLPREREAGKRAGNAGSWILDLSFSHGRRACIASPLPSHFAVP
jgi:hypothetical protein